MRAGVMLCCAAITLHGCSYREIRPSADAQDAQRAQVERGSAENAPIERFGAMRFQQIAPDVWQHTSYLDLPGFGSVPSNGLIVVDGDGAILVDTAWTDDQTAQLLQWAQARLGKPVRVAILTHAHSDKMGGMAALHAANIATYAHETSNAIAPDKGLLPARNALVFDADGELTGARPAAFGPLRVFYPGPGHTRDNITVGIGAASLAFGGCLIKGSDATSLGNLAEADTKNYRAAVARFAAAFPDARIIAMSHSGAQDRAAIARTAKLAADLD